MNVPWRVSHYSVIVIGYITDITQAEYAEVKHALGPTLARQAAPMGDCSTMECQSGFLIGLLVIVGGTHV